MGKLARLARLCVLTSLAAAIAFGQTATSGLLQGTVTDPSGAAIPNTTVEATDKATGNGIRQTTNSEGQYLFPSLAPGEYSIKVSASGFATVTVPSLRVEVTRVTTQDIKLEVGQSTQTVVVTAEARVELQTVDATVGNVIPSTKLPTLPTFTRQVNELLTLQPAATPAGEVAGARRDQSTLTLDGIDVSNNSTGGTASYMYLGVEGVEEYRVGVANANASFGRGAGGQVSLIGRRGENRLHGAGFWYHQNDNLNANTWTRNRIGLRKPEAKDNRYGARISGPIIKDHTFFFANWDARRFPRATTVTRIVPTDTLRNGILQFRDAAGTVNQYNLRTSTTCGAEGNQACDPRGLGLSPTIAALWRNLPAGNDPSQGDGLNTIGLTGNVGNPIEYNFYNARVDHQLTTSWRIEASIRYFNQLDIDGASVDIRNAGAFQSIRTFPTRQNMEVIALTGAIKPNLTADFRFGRVRNRAATDVFRPSASSAALNLPGTITSAGAIALDIGARGGAQSILSEPFDVDTQLARKQQNDAKIYQYNADFNWLKNKHNFQFGFHLRDLPTLHRRDDKVLGALGSLVAQIDSQLGGVITFPASVAPPSCGGGRTTGCVQSADLQTYYRLFSGVTGIIDNISVLAARDGSFKPLPFGDLLESDTSGMRAPEFYFQDSWKLRPSLTVTLGLNYGWQTAPTERLGRYTIQTLTDGTVVTADQFMAQRMAAAQQGNFYNPNFAFNPVNNIKRKVFDTDWNNWAPRAAVAWQPGFKSGLLGRMFGDKRTVFRGGYGLAFDRFNTVQGVIIPSLGIGFAQTLNVTAPKCTTGPGCQASNTNPALNGFRVGVDGTIPLPTVPEQTIPVSPAWGRINNAVVTFPEVLSFQVDPKFKIGENHSLNFTIQRELPGATVVEVGYLGRFARNLPQSANLLQSPYMFVDRASNQSFAQAFDNIARVVRANNAAALPAQGFFENMMPGGTAALAANRTDFLNGNIANVFLAMDRARLNASLQPFNNLMSQMMLLRTGTGRSNYHAGIATVRKSSKSVDMVVNYTFSKSLDQLGEWQNSANVMPNYFNQDVEYGPSLFDITHVLSAFGTYRLSFKSSNGFLDRVIGGWEISNIFTARSGDPLTVVQGSQVWGGGLTLGFNSGAIPTQNPANFGNEINRNIAGSNNVGTNGNPATRGTGLNLYGNPENVFNSFRRVEISSDGRTGRANPLRGLARWNLDTSLAKSVKIAGGDNPVSMRLSFDFFNIFNNVTFVNPTLDLNNPRAFGVLTTQFTPLNRTDGSRWIQIGARFEF